MGEARCVFRLFVQVARNRTYYREEDFAGFENFIEIYKRFQKLLNHIREVRNEFGGISVQRLIRIKIFDLKKIDTMLDEVITLL